MLRNCYDKNIKSMIIYFQITKKYQFSQKVVLHKYMQHID